MRTPLLSGLGLLLASCSPFDNLPDNGSHWIDAPLWDAEVTAATDGVYVRLPYAGQLVRVRNDGRFDTVDLKGAEPTRLVPTPSGEKVLVFARWQSCEDPEVAFASDCDEDELDWTSELAVVADGIREAVTAVPAHLNQLDFAPGGDVAVAYLDYSLGQDIEIENGVIDLTEVVFIDLVTGETEAVSIGFSPSNILFSDDGTTAVVMSRSKVVVVDLADFTVAVEYPLTLDADDEIDPSDAVLTPTGSHVLVAIDGRDELYKLDLDNYSIDILSMDDSPSDLAVSSEADRTVVTYRSLTQVDLIEHDYYSTESIDLDDPMNEILVTGNQAVLYNSATNYLDVYRIDLDTTELIEYRVANPLNSLELTDDGLYAVGIMRPESSYEGGLDGYQDDRYGLAVIGLEGDEAVSLVLESRPVGVALTQPEEGGANYALVLPEGGEELLQIDLVDPSVPTIIELPSSPVGIGALPGGNFYITHEAALGQITFVDPLTGEPTTVSGFADVDLFGDDSLPRQGGGN